MVFLEPNEVLVRSSIDCPSAYNTFIRIRRSLNGLSAAIYSVDRPHGLVDPLCPMQGRFSRYHLLAGYPPTQEKQG